MIKKILFLFVLFSIGISILIYNRILFDHIDYYSDILDYQLVGLSLGCISILYLIFSKKKQTLINVTFLFLGLLLLSLIILNFVAKYKIDNYPKLF